MNGYLTARYKAVQNGSEALCQLFCDLSGGLVCTVKASDGFVFDFLAHILR